MPEQKFPPIDPVQFCAGQVQALRLALDGLTAEVRRLGNAIDDLRAGLVADSEAGASKALARLAQDSDHARPYWERGADHIGQRWYDTWSKWLGGWLTKLIGGAALTAAVVWWVTTNGGKR